MRLSRILSATKSIKDDLKDWRKPKFESKSLTDFILWLYRERNFSLISGSKKFLETKRLESIELANRFYEYDYHKLGADLHAAKYVLNLNGRCRIGGSAKWLSSQNTNVDNILPKSRVNNFELEGIDLSNTVIQYNGISNIENCRNLKTLIMKNCVFNDDWTLNRIAQAFTDSLEHLDISNCAQVTDNGLETLAFLRNLKTLKLDNLEAVENKEFISLLLEDLNENLQIEGSNHLDSESVKNIEQKFEKEQAEIEKKKTIVENSSNST